MDEPIKGILDIHIKGKLINNQSYHEGTLTDRYGNQYPIFINVFNHKKVKRK